MEVTGDNGADAENGEDVHDPLRADQLEKEGEEEEEHGDDDENGEDVHDPLRADQLEKEGEEEEEHGDDDDAADDEDVPAAAGAKEASPNAVLAKLVAADYGTNSPTSKGTRRLSMTGKGTWSNIKRIKSKGEREVLGANSDGELRKVSDVFHNSLYMRPSFTSFIRLG